MIEKNYGDYSFKDRYNTYISRVKGIHYDRHVGLQLVYIVDGEVELVLENGSRTYAKGDIFLFNRAENKFIYSFREDSFILVLNIDESYLRSKASSSYLAIFNRDLDHLSNMNDLRNLIIHLYRLSDREAEKYYIEDKLDHIMKILINDYTKLDSYSAGYEEQLSYVRDLKQHVYGNKLSQVNLRDIADEMYISNSYLSTIFKDITGESFSDFIQQYKLSIATRYLVKTSTTIENIASRIGFSSTKSLNTLFNRHLDITPSAFRKKYRLEEEEEYNYNYINSILESLDDSGYKDIYDDKGLNFHRFSIDDKAISHRKNWKIIHSLKSLGRNYIRNLCALLGEFHISEIYLNFYLEDGKIYIDDERELLGGDLYDLLHLILKYELVPTFIVKDRELDIENIDQEAMLDSVEAMSDFYGQVLDMVGVSNMKKFKYSLDVGPLEYFYEDREKLELYRNYLILQQRLLAAILGSKDYVWGYELGYVDKEKIIRLKEIYDMFDIEIYKPSFMLLSYEIDNIMEARSVEDGVNIIEKVQEKIDLYGVYLENCSEKFESIYIRNVFRQIDLTELSDDYKDLFAILLMNETIFFLESDYNYRLEYQMMDGEAEDDSYYPSIVNKYGFKTPIYWFFHILDQFRGDIIYRERNLIASREDEDLYVLVFGNALVDIIFSKKNNFVNLDKYYSEVKFIVENMEGRYKVTEEILSYENGGVEYNIGDYKNYKYLDRTEKEQVARMSMPSFKMEIRELSNSYYDKIRYSPFNIILKKYRKI